MNEFKKKRLVDTGWEFWIDVGGTFTDCLARQPNGKVRAHKLLSIGAYHGKCAPDSSASRIIDTTRLGAPDGYFKGFEIEWEIDDASDKSEFTSGRITDSNGKIGSLELEQDLASPPRPGLRYTLAGQEEAPVLGIRWLMGLSPEEQTGPITVRLGTTKGTNALLERQGAKTALVTTRGFRDVLRIAYQNRARLFDLHVRKPEDLYHSVIEIDERLDAEGRVIQTPNEDRIREQLASIAADGVESLAVCLLHSHRNPEHERLIGQVASEAGFAQVSLSSELNPLPRIVSRGDTTVVDAYLTPILRNYLKRIATALPEAHIRLMTSAGSLVSVESFVGKDSILSGPAGGVVGAAGVARSVNQPKVIGFDMGGTSTDVCRYDGEFERRYEMELTDKESAGAIRVAAPMLAVETVAAGGGSICWFDGQKPVVGPRSAGADPGPACYGRGGPMTVTDVNFFLGRVIPDRFPFPLDREAVVRRLDELIEEIKSGSGRTYTREELAEGLIQIANANMNAPIKKISLARGYDVREYSLVSYGGAGSQHACAIAAELGVTEILCSRYAGALSALGIGMANVAHYGERAIGLTASKMLGPVAQVSDPSPSYLDSIFSELESDLRAKLRADGVNEARILPSRRLLDMRHRGQETRITVPEPDDGDYSRAFTAEHKRLYGFTFPDREIEIYAARMELAAQSPPLPPSNAKPVPRKPAADRITHARFSGKSMETGIFLREHLKPGDEIKGPAIIAESIATIVVEPDWTAHVNEHNDIVLKAKCELGNAKSDGKAERRLGNAEWETEPDPIELELFNNHFASIAELMGTTLEKTALSTNVKERLDFSCAIFTAVGDLVVNAPHIPVHLGSMSACVRCLREDAGEFLPGDIYVTNDPYRGGSHLPDVTVITPVFIDNPDSTPPTLHPSATPDFFVASRAHHSEIGGITPGSMPPFSKTLAEEGVVIRAFRLAAGEFSYESNLRELLSSGSHPSRSVDENIADTNAQAAANQVGVRMLNEMAARHGLEKVRAYMGHIQRAAEYLMRAALLKLPENNRTFTDQLDNGARITATITIRHPPVAQVSKPAVSPASKPAESGNAACIEQDSKPRTGHGPADSETCASATVDFTGTDPVMPGNLNANRAIVMSALIYCFRSLIEDDIPLNSGILAPIDVILPDACLLNPMPDPDPAKCPAVVGGNVETSQRVVDVVFGALGVVAASQGTMNNLLFGRSSEKPFGYYETICGGAGAGPDFDGANAVQTHMTNTRLTDPEVLESRYPVRLLRTEIRKGSGGNGAHMGGDGIVREIEFLEPVEVSLLTNRRTTNPFGLDGGGSGLSGRNRLKRVGCDEFEDLSPAAQFTANPGDILRIETPGGGGFGKSRT